MTGPEYAGLPWRKSSVSGANGDCVEVAVGREHVYVRHSERGDGHVIAFLHSQWEAFIAGVLKGEFGLPNRHRGPSNSC